MKDEIEAVISEHRKLLFARLEMIEKEMLKMTESITRAVDKQATTFENMRSDLTGEDGILQRLIPSHSQSWMQAVTNQAPIILLCILSVIMLLRDSTTRASITTPAGSAVLEPSK